MPLPPSVDAPQGKRWHRRDARVLVFPMIGLLFAATTLGKAFGPLLLRDAPLLLLALQPNPPEMLLVGAKVGLVPFVIVVTLARCSADVTYYLLGRWYGARALHGLARWLGQGTGLVKRLERLPPRARDLAVVFFPQPPVLVAVGVAGMPLWRYMALKLPGAVAVMVAVRLLAAAGASPLALVVTFIERYAGRLTMVVATLTALGLLVAWRRARAAAVATSAAG